MSAKKSTQKTETTPSKAPQKPHAKTAFCKELDCTEKAAVNGFCRLHFLRIVKGKPLSNPKGEKVEAQAKERRKSNRLIGLDSLGDDESLPTEAVETMGNLDIDINTVVDIDDSELPAPNPGEIETFKKTGS